MLRSCLLAAIPLVFLLVPVVGPADNCTFRVHSCVDPELGRVDIRVFNGDDAVHMIPVTEFTNAMSGVHASLACARSVCDMAIHLVNRPNGDPEILTWSYDECKDHSVVYQDGDLVLMDRLGSCFGY